MAPLKHVSFISALLVFSFLISSCTDDIINIGSKITVNGTVVDYGGLNLHDMLVSINGSAPVKTGPTGQFGISNVTAPYDVTVFNDKDSTFAVYQRLTTSEPVLMIRSQYPMQNVKFGDIYIKHPKVPPGKRVVTYPVCFDNLITGGSNNSSDSVTQVGLQWPAEHNSISGKLPLLVCSSQSYNSIDSYDNYGIKDFTLQSGGTDTIVFTEQDISFNPPELENSITPPLGFGPIHIEVYISFKNAWRYSRLFVFGSNSFTGGIVKVPGGLNPDYDVLVNFYDTTLRNECSKLASPGSSISLEYAFPVVLAYPSGDTSGVNNNTMFSYGLDHPSGIYTIQFYSAEYRYSVEVNTEATNVKLPDLSVFGKYLQPGKNMMWTVSRKYGYNGINGFASWAVCKNPVNTIFSNYSETRSFRTGNW